MADTGKIAKNLERFAQAVAAHDRENPTHTAHGIGLAHFDMERLGFDEGEEILPGITIHGDSGVTGNFRVLCDGEHDEELSEAEEQFTSGPTKKAHPKPKTQETTDDLVFEQATNVSVAKARRRFMTRSASTSKRPLQRRKR